MPRTKQRLKELKRKKSSTHQRTMKRDEFLRHENHQMKLRGKGERERVKEKSVCGILDKITRQTHKIDYERQRQQCLTTLQMLCVVIPTPS